MRYIPWIVALLLAPAPAALADGVRLVNGDSLHGTITEWKHETIVLDHPVLGRIEIPRDQIIGPALPTTPEEGSPAPIAATDEPVGEPEGKASATSKPGLFGTGFLAGWTRNLAVGVSGSQGKSRELTFEGRLTAGYEDDRDRWKFDSAYRFSSSDGEAETNEFYTQLNKDWLFVDSKWFVFLEGRYDYDEFKDWDHRVAGDAGVGYHFVKKETWDLAGRLGAGVSQTIGGEQTLAPEAVVGLDARWRMNDWQTVSITNSFFPNMRDFGEFRTLSKIDWILAISQRLGLSLRLSLMNEYESIAEEEKNDFKYVGSLGYDF